MLSEFNLAFNITSLRKVERHMVADNHHLERLGALDTCAVSDALDALGLPGAVVGIHSLTVRRRICGRARTVDLVEAGATGSRRHLGTEAVDASGPGDVLVIAHGGRTHVAGWGGVLSTGAHVRGIEGVIVDGAVRDVDEATELNLPVYARAAVPVTARGRVVERDWNVPVVVGGIPVSPGDYVIADSSGVVFIPSARVEAVLDRADAVAAKERAMVANVHANLPMVEVMGADYENLLVEQ